MPDEKQPDPALEPVADRHKRRDAALAAAKEAVAAAPDAADAAAAAAKEATDARDAETAASRERPTMADLDRGPQRPPE